MGRIRGDPGWHIEVVDAALPALVPAGCYWVARAGGSFRFQLELVLYPLRSFRAVLASWLRTRTQPADKPRRPRYRQVIAVDGKTVRGARRADGTQVHLLSTRETGTGIVLAQVTVNAKSIESRCSSRYWTRSNMSWAACKT